MKVRLKIDPAVPEAEVWVVAPAHTAAADALAEKLRQCCAPPAVTAYNGQRALLLDTAEILRFFTDGKAVRVQTAQGVYTVRARLYELEETLRGQRFARISQSELVNLAHVTALDLRFSGALRMTLTGGVVCYPSRRCLKTIKQALGLR